MSPSIHVGSSATARVVVALMRAVPALFATGLLAVAAVWLHQGRPPRMNRALLPARRIVR